MPPEAKWAVRATFFAVALQFSTVFEILSRWLVATDGENFRNLVIGLALLTFLVWIHFMLRERALIQAPQSLRQKLRHRPWF